jgi:hypothetical protein
VQDATLAGVRQNFAGYDLKTYTLSASLFDPDQEVNGMFKTSLGKFLICGKFQLVDALVRNNLAAININTGLATAWNPSASKDVFALALKDTILFVGGFFDYVGGANRKYLAALSSKTAKATAWNADASDYVFSLVIRDTVLYAGGRFSTVKNIYRGHAAGISTNGTGTLTSWYPNPNSDVFAIQPLTGGTNVYIGGQFGMVKNTAQFNLAKTSGNGSLVNWKPTPDCTIQSFAQSGSTLLRWGMLWFRGKRASLFR